MCSLERSPLPAAIAIRLTSSSGVTPVFAAALPGIFARSPDTRAMAATMEAAAAAEATLTSADVARRVGVSSRTVRDWADRGDLPAVRLTPRSPRRFRAEDVEELLERAQQGGR